MEERLKHQLRNWAEQYNDRRYFQQDPVAFPRHFVETGASLRDIEIAAVFASHLAWGRREMIVRDCRRLFDHMEWRPQEYVMNGEWRSDDSSLHRTVKWNEIASICKSLKEFYSTHESLESLDAAAMRVRIFGSKPDPKAANKKINMMRRWMIRDDGKVDLGVWKHSDKRQLIIPLDTHVYSQAFSLELTKRHQKDIGTALEITDAFREIFPEDPCLGDFALFGHGVTSKTNTKSDL